MENDHAKMCDLISQCANTPWLTQHPNTCRLENMGGSRVAAGAKPQSVFFGGTKDAERKEEVCKDKGVLNIDLEISLHVYISWAWVSHNKLTTRASRPSYCPTCWTTSTTRPAPPAAYPPTAAASLSPSSWTSRGTSAGRSSDHQARAIC